MAILDCVGCGRDIGWDGRGTYCYTCPCGATVFWSLDGTAAYPTSLLLAVTRGQQPGHLDHYVGVSAHTSPEKKALIRELRTRGAVWSWECEECQRSHCPFRWQCAGFKMLRADSLALVGEVCMTGRHQDCVLYRELRDQVMAIEKEGGG